MICDQIWFWWVEIAFFLTVGKNKWVYMIDIRFDDIHHLSGWWFQPTPLKNMTSSVGMMNFPYTMESHESYVPNHQPDEIASHMWYIYIYTYTFIICIHLPWTELSNVGKTTSSTDHLKKMEVHWWYLRGLSNVGGFHKWGSQKMDGL